MKFCRTIIITSLAMMAGTVAIAATDLEIALEDGGTVLTSDEIADLITSKVVTAKAGDKTFRFFYDPSNVLNGELQGGGWSGSGAYAITDGNQVCVSMAKDAGRYRCLTVVRQGETVRKFNADGKATFELLEIEPANGL